MAFFVFGQVCPSAGAPLRLSVYCTAGDVQRYLSTPAARERTWEALRPLRPSRLFLEGRRGDEYVSPEILGEVRGFFEARRIVCSGGIATVPGETFGVRQTGGLSWLNWESAKVRTDVARFFTENAPVFKELIVDDFFCTGDVSAESERARGGRSWGSYRQDLMVSLLEPVVTGPARAASRKTRLIIKFPQWYDRFHLFGYDPTRMAARFDQVWVGTEVRDPETRRMGFVQPTEGYMNFLWLHSIAGRKVTGAWFDHIECGAEKFVDQAYGSVLAGARELTLFRLGDIMEGHPGDALLAKHLKELGAIAGWIRAKTRDGIPFYKPPGGESEENIYLADYLGILGLPILPVADYPAKAKVVFLPVQAAADTNLLAKMKRHWDRGATVVLTPALLRRLEPAASSLAGVQVGKNSMASTTSLVRIRNESWALETPLDLDAAVHAEDSEVCVAAFPQEGSTPLLTRKVVGRGQAMVLNVRTFSEQDFRQAGEWLLAPRALGLARIPEPLAETLQSHLLLPLEVDFSAPAGIALFLFGRDACVYNFRDATVSFTFGGQRYNAPPRQVVWVR